MCCLLTTVLTLGSNLTVFAAKVDPQNNTVAPSPYEVTTTLQQNSLKNVTAKELVEANANGFEIMEKVTDPSTIQQMVNDGLAETDENGNLPTSITTYFASDKNVESNLLEQQSSLLRSSGISVTKTRYYDGQYFDDYDRYVVDGPSEFEVTYSKKGIQIGTPICLAMFLLVVQFTVLLSLKRLFLQRLVMNLERNTQKHKDILLTSRKINIGK